MRAPVRPKAFLCAAFRRKAELSGFPGARSESLDSGLRRNDGKNQNLKRNPTIGLTVESFKYPDASPSATFEYITPA